MPHMPRTTHITAAKKLPDHDQVVHVQMELLRLGRYEDAEKLSLQFSADEVSIYHIEYLLEGLSLPPILPFIHPSLFLFPL